ncbi:SRSF protein kinase 2-like isoform X1 [Photinus pyralis]|uniref:non-specific serine/threonine protein kinase n=3 Tax=Photinus pyralis TaxID=7054 RepID=A0A1Y1LDR1_PHOPY|nr:SRSF protein kinase 2-like isoform X1 [Photinus pyralis]
MLNLITEDEFQCFGNFTPYPIRNEPEESTSNSMTGIFISSFITFIAYNVIVTLTNTKNVRKNIEKHRKKIVKRLSKPSASCTPNIRRFQPIESPSTFSIKKLQEIAEKDQDADIESALDYCPGGYMPVTIGQTIGPDNRYQIVRKLGWGHFSTVWLCEDISEGQTYYAIKIVKSANSFKTVALDEIKLLRCVKDQEPTAAGYDKIVLYHDYFIASSLYGEHLCLTFELMGPSLLHLIVQSNYQGLEKEGVKNIIKQILLALTYLHENCKIIHTDIKPENILISVKEPYIRNMVAHVNRFNELGVQMPKSYVNAAGWNEPEFFEQSCDEASTSNVIYSQRVDPRRTSCPNKVFVNDFSKPIKVKQDQRPVSPLFVDPGIQVKIADLGNSCWEDHHFAEVIQTLQYRALEVIIESDYSFAADIWSVACLAFELSTGDFLFNPQASEHLSCAEDHLGLIWELLNGIPPYIAHSGRRSSEYFTSAGTLKRISPENMKIWKVEDVLVDKYQWKRVDAILLADFIESLIEPDQDLRATASSALNKKWLNSIDSH